MSDQEQQQHRALDGRIRSFVTDELQKGLVELQSHLQIPIDEIDADVKEHSTQIVELQGRIKEIVEQQEPRFRGLAESGKRVEMRLERLEKQPLNSVLDQRLTKLEQDGIPAGVADKLSKVEGQIAERFAALQQPPLLADIIHPNSAKAFEASTQRLEHRMGKATTQLEAQRLMYEYGDDVASQTNLDGSTVWYAHMTAPEVFGMAFASGLIAVMGNRWLEMRKTKKWLTQHGRTIEEVRDFVKAGNPEAADMGPRAQAKVVDIRSVRRGVRRAG